MGLRGRIVLVTLAVVALVIFAASAAGQRGGPVAHIACAKDATDCTEQGSITTPAHGEGVQATDVVPTGSTQGTEVLAPFSKSDLAGFDSLWFSVVDGTPSLASVKNVFVRRLLTCAIIAPFVTSFGTPAAVTAVASNSDPADLFAQVCVQTVYATYLAEGGPAADAAASGGCAMGLVSIPVEIKRAGGKYVAQIQATTRKASGHSPLVISCRKRGSGLQIAMRPKARHRKLYRVLGGHMTIGVANKSNTPVRVRTTFAFR